MKKILFIIAAKEKLEIVKVQDFGSEFLARFSPSQAAKCVRTISNIVHQMKQNITNEFSFRLKPCEHGVGVFAMHDIKKGTYLRLFGDEDINNPDSFKDCRFLKDEDVPDEFKDLCIYRGEGMVICAKDFGCMPIGWYINHSKTPNAGHKDYNYYALRDVSSGEEITIDYGTLEEPEEDKDEFYK